MSFDLTLHPVFQLGHVTEVHDRFHLGVAQCVADFSGVHCVVPLHFSFCLSHITTSVALD